MILGNNCLVDLAAKSGFDWLEPPTLGEQVERIYRPTQAWSWMMQSLQTPTPDEWVRDEVLSAWRRCLEDHQIQYGIEHPISVQKDRDLAIPDRSLILRIVRLALESIRPLLRDGSITLCVSDSKGGLLALMGRSLVSHDCSERNIFRKIGNWNEAFIGNNGMGTAAFIGEAAAFSAEEHFLPLLHPLTTSGCPLQIDGRSSPLVLGLIAESRIPANFLLALTVLAAQHVQKDLLGDGQSTPESIELSGKKLARGVSNNLNPATCTDCGCEGQPSQRLNPLDNLVAQAARLQSRKIPILVVGESGAGKEHLIRSAFQQGLRRAGPFIALNCASIPRELIESELFGYAPGSFTGAKKEGKPGKFQLADQGVLFLDEIGEMPLDLQAVLLRVLENSEFFPIGANKPVKVDVQIFAATNIPIQEAVRAGKFRADLYYRLNGTQIFLPPLREREDKRKLILGIYVEELRMADLNPDLRLSDEVIGLFMRHPWPGNLRQLKNVIRTALTISNDGLIRMEDFPDSFLSEIPDRMVSPASGAVDPAAVSHQMAWVTSETAPAGNRDAMSMSEWSARAIENALAASKGNLSKTANLLGISRTTLYKKLSHYQIDPKSFSGSEA